MIREIVNIDEQLCDGCGDCVPACAEGAIQIIDGKARLISDLFCDGLGACLGYCPQGAITIEMREAAPYNERLVMETIVKGGEEVIKAHLNHLRDHGEHEYFSQAIDYLNEIGMSYVISELAESKSELVCGCQGSQSKEIVRQESIEANGVRYSQLRQWPVQLHLVSPLANYFKYSDLLLTADCVPFAYADFHNDFLINKSLAIACPKLDTNKQVYLNKLVMMINDSNIKSITVLIMQVPCCSGLMQMAQQAIELSKRKIPLRVNVISIEGEVLQDVEINI
ncbi:MAG: 4Fe-4S ferredoxin [Ignavibacteria bacterium]|nr:4Fe-4S ferredoxin [Ignavibacteria bacterium]